METKTKIDRELIVYDKNDSNKRSYKADAIETRTLKAGLENSLNGEQFKINTVCPSKKDGEKINQQLNLSFEMQETKNAPSCSVLPCHAPRLQIRKDDKTDVEKITSHILDADEAIWLDFYGGVLNMITNNPNMKGRCEICGKTAIVFMTWNEMCACEFGNFWDMEKKELKRGAQETLKRQYYRFGRMVQKGISPLIHLTATFGDNTISKDTTSIRVHSRVSVNDSPSIFELWLDTRVMPLKMKDGNIVFANGQRYITFEPGLYALLQVGRRKVVELHKDIDLSLPSALTAMRLLQITEAIIQKQSIPGVSVEKVGGSYTYVKMGSKIISNIFTHYINEYGRMDMENINDALVNSFAMYRHGLHEAGIFLPINKLVPHRVCTSGDSFTIVMKDAMDPDYIADSVSLHPDKYKKKEALPDTTNKKETQGQIVLEPQRRLLKTSKAQIKAERKERAQGMADKGYTRAQIAEVLGVTERTVQRMNLVYKKE